MPVDFWPEPAATTKTPGPPPSPPSSPPTSGASPTTTPCSFGLDFNFQFVDDVDCFTGDGEDMLIAPTSLDIGPNLLTSPVLLTEIDIQTCTEDDVPFDSFLQIERNDYAQAMVGGTAMMMGSSEQDEATVGAKDRPPPKPPD